MASASWLGAAVAMTMPSIDSSWINVSTSTGLAAKADPNSAAFSAWRSATAANASSWARLRAKFRPHMPHPIRPIFIIA